MAKISSKVNRPETKIQYSISAITTLKKVITLDANLNYEDLPNPAYLFSASVDFLNESLKIEVEYKFFSNQTILLDLVVENLYRLHNFSEVVTDGKMSNKKFLLFLVELSIGHLRGVQSTVVAGTKISNYYLPFISESKLSNRINFNSIIAHAIPL